MTDDGSPVPPVGLMPKYLWLDQVRNQRVNDIVAALERYAFAGRAANPDWIVELQDLLQEPNAEQKQLG